jgi:hypothetical protein
MRKPKTRKPPLPAGTPVDINLAQGLAVAQGVVTAAEYDDGWLYRIDITGGDRCDAHRNDAGELWVCEHEVSADDACDAVLEQIARQTLGIATLRTRGSDQLDFHDLGVSSIHEALRAAYQAGRQSAK